jgi:protein phosphatase
MTADPAPAAKPTDAEIDTWGLTHVGRVRAVNQDHFAIASLHKHMAVHLTSVPDLRELAGARERLAYLAMVADGVGASEHGEEASRLALATAMEYVAESMQAYYETQANEAAFAEALQAAAIRCHERVRAQAEAEHARSMATTLTLYLGVWPWSYLLQVGDSRYYLFRDGVLTQVTRDQTMAQDLVDQGVLSRVDAARTPLANVLSSAIGGQVTAPVVTRIRNDRRSVHLLCSDGLTKHVSDERIREVLAGMTSARQACETLLQDALDGGGSDNVTLIVGRILPAAA